MKTSHYQSARGFGTGEYLKGIESLRHLMPTSDPLLENLAVEVRVLLR
jgi:hypothetical protein